MAPTKSSNSASDYEIQRQEKIAQNQALLKELQLNAASAGVASKSKSTQNRSSTSSSHKKPAATKKIKKEEDFQPRRVSSRIRGIVADSEVAKRKWDEEQEVVREEERKKKLRRSDDFAVKDALVAGQEWNKSGNWLRDVQPANPYERSFTEEDVKKTSDKELRALREKMSGLELWEGVEPNRIKITPERIYAMGFHPSEEKAVVFAGDKMGNLGVFDGGQEKGKEEEEDDEDAWDPAITTFKLHTRTISCIHFTPSQPKALYTSSYDSSARRLDLEKGVSMEVYGPESNEMDDPLSGISIPVTEPNLLYYTTLNGLFGIHDTRTGASSSPTQHMQLSDKKIGGFSIHPTQPHFLATASLDRTLKLWDLRKTTGRGGAQMPALVAEHESKLSVSHAAFNAAGQIATCKSSVGETFGDATLTSISLASYDDTIKIHTLPSLGSSLRPGQELPDFKPTTAIPHNNQTGRWVSYLSYSPVPYRSRLLLQVTILRPHWQAAPASGPQRFVIGNMNRFVDVYTGTGEQLAQLGGEGITAVPAVAAFHDRQDWIAGGTASGKLALWL